ncbi:prepilin-type N-terminal cleavage/methylation domain-containing protein [Terrilactibacillus sp. BCM23-1]|uniref:Prepilin-type N-terminal cleavage/methylation domain-containing protein n=1 Tax=Terrilactibacillus tamarindi TaxID=2599694 RepID=A0A6N8CS42_9BACI|nr:prepilin-type N-terminal cleavage/methylation domain-containing protein [Terrilactibacillus tamarindi]MTT31745.1 prepilin-type N-terminal cleavage/methylation domain-containing protein [Terrilactibacillus tamarindi]
MTCNDKGMTLIEILAAITLLSVVLISFASFFIQSGRVTTFNGVKSTALQLAQNQISKTTYAGSTLGCSTQSISSPTPVPQGSKCIVNLTKQVSDNHTYQLYTYLLEPSNNTNLSTYVVRSYYSNTNYVELYNYYTAKQN